MLRYLLASSLLLQPLGASTTWLHAKKDAIVNEHGEQVILRAINVGGWLVEELWMMPFVTTPPTSSNFTPITDHVSLWKTLETRFGKEAVYRLKNQQRKSWFNEKDFDSIKELGFNAVRLPFIYDLVDEPRGLYVWLDWAIEEAKKRDLYVILDMHGAPGRQSKEQHTGQENVDRLFFHEKELEQTKALWKEIAKRYKNTATVAGYDLLNEPMGAPTTEALHHVYQEIYNAIRKVDKKHLIFIEDGYKGIDTMHPELYSKMENIALSVHLYAPDAHSADDYVEHLHLKLHQYHEFTKTCELPFYLGEFNVLPHGNTDTIKTYIEILEEKQASWSPWTYKVANNGLKKSLWGIYTPKKDLKNIDPFQDSEDEIMKKLKQLDTQNFEQNEALARVYKH